MDSIFKTSLNTMTLKINEIRVKRSEAQFTVNLNEGRVL